MSAAMPRRCSTMASAIPAMPPPTFRTRLTSDVAMAADNGQLPHRSCHKRSPMVQEMRGAADAAKAAAVEQRRRKQQRAGNRRARGTGVARAADIGGKAVGRFRTIDQPPRHDDLLMMRAGPFEIGHGDAAVHALLQRLK